MEDLGHMGDAQGRKSVNTTVNQQNIGRSEGKEYGTKLDMGEQSRMSWALWQLGWADVLYINTRN